MSRSSLISSFALAALVLTGICVAMRVGADSVADGRTELPFRDLPEREPSPSFGESRREVPKTSERAQIDDAERRELSLRAEVADLERRLKQLERGSLRPQRGDLGHEDPSRRRRAVRALEELAEYDPQARAAIRDMLVDDDAGVRVAAVQALAELEDREAIPLLRGLLEDPAAGVRGETVGALADMEATSEAAWIETRLRDVDSEVRAEAASALGRLRANDSVDALIRSLADEDDDVVGETIRALGELRAEAAQPALRDVFDSSRVCDSLRLAELLRDLGDPEPLGIEIDRISRVALQSPDSRKRRDAIRSLAKAARRESREIFERALEDTSVRVRREAERALERGG